MNQALSAHPDPRATDRACLCGRKTASLSANCLWNSRTQGMMTHAFPFQRTREIQVVPSQYTCSNVLPGTRYHPGCLGMVEAETRTDWDSDLTPRRSVVSRGLPEPTAFRKAR